LELSIIYQAAFLLTRLTEQSSNSSFNETSEQANERKLKLNTLENAFNLLSVVFLRQQEYHSVLVLIAECERKLNEIGRLQTFRTLKATQRFDLSHKLLR